MDKDLLAKAKRRVKRFLQTGEEQARVHKTVVKNVIEYRAGHYNNGESIMFKQDKLGRLQLCKN